MTTEEYHAFLRRADAAITVRELRAIADEARLQYPADPDADLVDSTCFTYATALLERTPERSTYLPAFIEPDVPRPVRAVVGVRHVAASRVLDFSRRDVLTFERGPS